MLQNAERSDEGGCSMFEIAVARHELLVVKFRIAQHCFETFWASILRYWNARHEFGRTLALPTPEHGLRLLMFPLEKQAVPSRVPRIKTPEVDCRPRFDRQVPRKRIESEPVAERNPQGSTVGDDWKPHPIALRSNETHHVDRVGSVFSKEVVTDNAEGAITFLPKEAGY